MEIRLITKSQIYNSHRYIHEIRELHRQTYVLCFHPKFQLCNHRSHPRDLQQSQYFHL